MAIAIPILIAATAAGATAAAAIGISATMLAIGTGLVLQVTGINDKINKAASKVFGEKLVSVANIAGSIFLGATAAGLIGGAAEAAGGAMAGAAGAAEGGAQAAANAAWSAGGAAEVAGGAGINGTASALSGVDAAQDVANAAWRSGGAAEVAASKASATPFDSSLRAAQQGATKVGEGLKTAWNSMGDKTQAAVLQMGGQALSGASAGKAAEEAEKARIANENRYKSGSGLTYWQRKPSYTPSGV
jgi:hypothetical protein